MDKQAFQQYRQLCREIRELEAEKEALAAGNLPASWPLGGLKGKGRHTDTVGEAAAQLWQLAQLLAQRLNQLVALRNEIEKTIEALQPEERRLLRLYYIDGLNWEQVAERLDYSTRQINRKQQQIMQQLFPEPTPTPPPTTSCLAPV